MFRMCSYRLPDWFVRAMSTGACGKRSICSHLAASIGATNTEGGLTRNLDQEGLGLCRALTASLPAWKHLLVILPPKPRLGLRYRLQAIDRPVLITIQPVIHIAWYLPGPLSAELALTVGLSTGAII